jgi:hypothetical protein
MRLRSATDVPAIRAAVWAIRSVRLARAGLKAGPVDAVRLPPPPPLPETAEKGVRAAFRRSAPTCLEQALVLQAWRAAHGDAREVVIAVRGSGDAFEAHAWLDGEPDPGAGAFLEIARVPTP